MDLMLPSICAIVLYLSATVYKGLSISNKQQNPRQITGIILISLAIAAHAFNVYSIIVTDEGINLGFFKVSSLIFLFISCIALTALIRGKPIDTLVVVLLPMAALSVVVSVAAPSPYQAKTTFDIGLLSHILFSILSYSVLFIASIQAVWLAVHERQLRRKYLAGLFEWLPPLQTMEELLFEMLWLGILLLSASILTGALFLDDIFAQHLVHKTVFSLAAWVIFAILLWGRHRLGWRSKTAVKWTLGGFVTLMLGYFGSKLVLELVLERF